MAISLSSLAQRSRLSKPPPNPSHPLPWPPCLHIPPGESSCLSWAKVLTGISPCQPSTLDLPLRPSVLNPQWSNPFPPPPRPWPRLASPVGSASLPLVLALEWLSPCRAGQAFARQDPAHWVGWWPPLWLDAPQCLNIRNKHIIRCTYV